MILKKYITRLQWLFNYVRNFYYLTSSQELEKLRSSAHVSLNRAEHKIYSQHGEDGILREIFNRIGTTSRTFFEFGAGSGVENNTIALLLDGWKGWWIDGGDYVEIYKKLYSTSLQNGKLTIAKKMVTPKTINQIVKDLSIPRDIDLLSIDIDGNDYHVWKALTELNPRVVVVEYNGAYPPGFHFLQKESEALWNGSNFFGASLHTMNELAKEKGYTLVCCELIGANAFFVRNDLVWDKFDYAGDVWKLWQKPKYYLHYYGGHMPTIQYGETPTIGEWVSRDNN
jgi:hypothetical protein